MVHQKVLGLILSKDNYLMLYSINLRIFIYLRLHILNSDDKKSPYCQQGRDRSQNNPYMQGNGN